MTNTQPRFALDDDGHEDPTIWDTRTDPSPAVLRLSDLPTSARPYWDLIVAAFVAA